MKDSIQFIFALLKENIKYISNKIGLILYEEIWNTDKLINKNQIIGEIVHIYAAAAAKSLQSCLTLCDPRDGSPPGSPIPGILQARTLEWVAISFSNARKGKVKVKLLSRIWLLATSWTAAYQAPPSMGFARQEYWSGLPLPSPISMLLVLKTLPANAGDIRQAENSFFLYFFFSFGRAEGHARS